MFDHRRGQQAANLTMLKSLTLSLMLCLPISAQAETYLLMAEEAGCYWCARWNTEIAPIYPKTAEGRAAPLKRYDVHAETPDVELAKKVRFTPTFLLIKDGIEVGRIEGYPGEDFFWGLVGMMFDKAGMSLAEES